MNSVLGAVGTSGGTTRYLRGFFIAVLVIPIALLMAVSWLNYNAAFRDAHSRVSHAADAIHEYALKIFETDELILDHIAEHVAGADWSELVRSEEFHHYLQQFAARPQVSSVGLISRDHGLAATNPLFPAPAVTIEPPAYLQVERNGKEPIYIGTAVRGTFTAPPQFSVVRTDLSSVGGNGVIFVSTKVSDFVEYHRSIVDPRDFLVAMARLDGAVLSRSPREDLIGTVLSPASQFRREIAQKPEGGGYDAASEIDGVDRLFAYRKLGTYPVYVVVGLQRSAVIEGWVWLMARYLMVGLPATLCLVFLALIALRRSVAADRATAAAQVEVDRREIVEASLRQVQRMEIVGQLTGGVAHDFNNLLTVIAGNLDLILGRSEDAGRVRRLAEAALQATQRGERITHQLLVFSRRQVLRSETLNLNPYSPDEALILSALSPILIQYSVSYRSSNGAAMADPTGESKSAALRLDFDRRLMLRFRGSVITSDGGLLAYRELDDAVGLTDTGADTLADARTGKNGRHLLGGLLRQSVFGRLAGDEVVNDADRLCRDPAMRWVVGDRAITGSAASASQMGRFETEWLARPENLTALADLPGR